MDGILSINKHQGPTSFSIVAAVKRLTGEKKVGHAGTLDPLASGVLPICLGRATRVAEYLMDYPKKYRAEIAFGKTTDTYDAEGTVTSETDASDLDLATLGSLLPEFRGEIQQTPPAYSALKFQGKPYYELARAGQELEIPSRPVMIYDIETIDWKCPVLTLDITCGKGTYIRSIAHDLGQKTGFGGYMQNLERRACGPFTVTESVTLEGLERTVSENRLPEHLFAVDHVLQHFKSLTVDEATAHDISHGHSFSSESVISEKAAAVIPVTGRTDDTKSRVYTPDNRFIGLFRYNEALQEWKPEKIFC